MEKILDFLQMPFGLPGYIIIRIYSLEVIATIFKRPHLPGKGGITNDSFKTYHHLISMFHKPGFFQKIEPFRSFSPRYLDRGGSPYCPAFWGEAQYDLALQFIQSYQNIDACAPSGGLSGLLTP